MKSETNSQSDFNKKSEEDCSLDDYRKMLEGFAFEAANAYDKAIMSS